MSQRLHWSLIIATTFVVSVLLVWAHETWGRNPLAAADDDRSEVAPVLSIPAPPPVPATPSAPSVDDAPVPTPMPAPVLPPVVAQPVSLVATPVGTGTPASAVETQPPSQGSASPVPLVPPPSSAPVETRLPEPPLANVSPPRPQPGLDPLVAPANDQPPAPPMFSSPWSFHIAVVDGRTRLEARAGADIQLTVTSDHLTMQTPQGNLQASGSVHVVGPHVEGTCDSLTLAWSDEHVSLAGKVSLKCQQNGQDVDLSGEKLTIKLAAIETLPPPSPASTREMPNAAEEAK